MSAWGDYKAGLITDAEYNGACREEEFTSRYWAEHPDEFNDDKNDGFDESEDYFDDDEINEF